MSVLNKSVLLLKSQKADGDEDKYEVILRKNDFNVFQVKTLDFKYTNLEKLSKQLNKPDEYAGFIFSSPRCVNSVFQSLVGERINDRWKDKYNFAVGETTREFAFSLLGLDCKGSETGNANNLADFIIKQNLKTEKPFLFPHGNLKTDTLRNCGLNLGEVLVYETIANPSLEQEFAEVTSNFSTLPEYVVFFSPSGVQHTIDLIRKVPVNLDNIKFVSIGPVTEARIQEEDIKVYSVATRPTPENVLHAIMS